jgi:hypothetical protein
LVNGAGFRILQMRGKQRGQVEDIVDPEPAGVQASDWGNWQRLWFTVKALDCIRNNPDAKNSATQP